MTAPFHQLGAALLAVVLVAGCSGDAGSSTDEPARAERKAESTALDQAWQVSHEWYADTDVEGQWSMTWATESTIVFGRVTANDEVSAFVGLDADTGAERWELTLPTWQVACGVSSNANADGVAGLMLMNDPGHKPEGCASVAALDLESGKLLWTTPTPRSPAGPLSQMDVAVTDKTVTVAALCSAWRYQVGSGKALRPVGDRDGYQCHLTDSTLPLKDVLVERNVVVILTHDHWRCDSTAQLEAFDADSGRRHWRRPVAECADLGSGDGGRLSLEEPPLHDGIVSTEPLVVEADVRGVRGYRAIDSQGNTPLLGPPTAQGWNSGLERTSRVLGVSGTVLVVTSNSTVQGYDLSMQDGAPTGEVLWARPLRESEDVVGVSGTGVLTLAAEGEETAEEWLTLSDLQDVTRTTRLGSVPALPDAELEEGAVQAGLPAKYDLAGDLLIAVTSNQVYAFKVPTTG